MRPVAWYVRELAALVALGGCFYLLLQVLALIAPDRVPR
jgi:hypothetical protein